MNILLSKAQIRSIQTEKKFKAEGKIINSESIYIVNTTTFYVAKIKNNIVNFKDSIVLNFDNFTCECTIVEKLSEGEDYLDRIEFFGIDASNIEAVYTLKINKIIP